LFAPLAGTMVRFNDDLLKDPAAINVETYAGGWLFEMTGAESDTIDVQEYYNFLEAGWEKTQNMLKGHM
jgi:glycine cleavage system H protein